MKIKKSVIALIMSFMLLFAGASTANALEKPPQAASDTYSSIANPSPGAETRAGVKWAGKQGAKALANALRSPFADNVIDALPNLDKAARTTLKNNKGAVADSLDEVAKLTDIPENAVREQLFNLLTKANVGNGDAQLIAEVIASLVGIMV